VLWIGIRIEYGRLIRIKEAKNDPQKYFKKYEISSRFEVMMFSFEGGRLLLQLGSPS
jgi:hypothetical protein